MGLGLKRLGKNAQFCVLTKFQLLLFHQTTQQRLRTVYRRMSGQQVQIRRSQMMHQNNKLAICHLVTRIIKDFFKFQHRHEKHNCLGFLPRKLTLFSFMTQMMVRPQSMISEEKLLILRLCKDLQMLFINAVLQKKQKQQQCASVVNIQDINQEFRGHPSHPALTFPWRLLLELEKEPWQTFSANEGVKRKKQQQGRRKDVWNINTQVKVKWKVNERPKLLLRAAQAEI